MDRQGPQDRPRDEPEREQGEEVVGDLEARDEDSAGVRGGGLKLDGIRGESQDKDHKG